MSDNSLFKKRVYGVQIIKSKNSNYNADFTGSPRTLPNGTVYATDKVAKYNIRNYLGRNNSEDIFVKETIHEKKQKKNEKEIITIGPRTLVETYEMFFCNSEEQKTLKEQTKNDVLRNLLKKLDVRLLGATFAPGGDDAKGKNISIHGPVQISYGINRFGKDILKDSGMFTDQIGAPYAKDSGADQTTLGSQTRSQEAHYVHHFSINPKNLSSYVNQFKNSEQKEDNDKSENGFKLLSPGDIQLLKEAMAVATTYYDSTSKKDSENELLLWIELDENSEKIMKNFTELIKISTDDDGKTIIDFDEVSHYLNKFSADIANIDIYYDDVFTTISGLKLNERIIEHKSLNDVLNNQQQEQDTTAS